ncbi:MAG: T9SS type A sorting domain-containing protein [Bacteroidetes bacterium]|nr:T9SS type A sorting domain-containing protein [Bacteroidota bacterium]
MNKLLLFLIIFLVQGGLRAQDWEWVIEIDSIQNLKTASDEQGNLFAAGVFEKSFYWDGTAYTSSANNSIFVIKYGQEGKVLWQKEISGTEILEIAEIKAFEGNIVIAGNFSGEISSSLIVKESAGNWDIFIAAFNSAGLLKFITTDGSKSDEKITSLDINKNNIVIAGEFQKGGSIGGLNFTSVSNESNIFIAKFSPDDGSIIFSTEVIARNGKAKKVRVFASGTAYIYTSIDGLTTLTDTIFHAESDINYLLKLTVNKITLFRKWSPYESITDFVIGPDDKISWLYQNGKHHSSSDLWVRKTDSINNGVWGSFFFGGSNTVEYREAIGQNIHSSKNLTVYSGIYAGNVWNSYSGNGLFVSVFSNDGKFITFRNTNHSSPGYIGSSGIATGLNDEIYISGKLSSEVSFGKYSINRKQLPVHFLAKLNLTGQIGPPTLSIVPDKYEIEPDTPFSISTKAHNVMYIKWILPSSQLVNGGPQEISYHLSPQRSYKECGLYSATAIISNNSGITDTLFFKDLIRVKREIQVSFNNEENLLCCSVSGKIGGPYKWFMNEVALDDETESCLLPRANGNYKVQVDFINNCGSDSATFKFESLGFLKHSFFHLSLHPNPTSSHFTLSFEAEKADVTITDFFGRQVLQRQMMSNENISTQGFSKGIYFVQVRIGAELVRRKLIIIN